MKLNFKITMLLIVSFFVILSAFTFTALSALRHNQSDNLALFKNEFVQTNLESFENCSSLFFGYFENEIATGKILDQNDAFVFAKKIDSAGGNIFIMDLEKRDITSTKNDPEILALLNTQNINSFINKWTLDVNKDDFAVDNLYKFTGGDLSITPARIRVKIYENLGLMVGYGKGFETGRVRVQFIQDQNEDFYFTYIISLLGIFALVMLVVPLASIWFMRRTVVEPIKSLSFVAQKITGGDLSGRAQVNSHDEIGDLSLSFNKMTENLIDSNQNLKAKVRELSEEHGRLSSLVESVKLGVVMVDLSLNIILSNSAAREAFGITRKKDMTFKVLSEKIKGKVDISQALSTYVRSGKSLNIQETMIGDSYYRLFMSPVRDIAQKVFIGAVFIMEDISEQKKIDQMRTEIVSITSHQLRTPATIIKGNLDMVLGGDVGKITPQQRELLDDTYTGNERMIHLVNDLMDASKIDEGKFVLPAEPVNLEELVGEVVKEIDLYAKKKNVELAFARSSEPLPQSMVNRQKVKQVIMNLIDNAIKYSSNGKSGKVVVAVKKVPKFLQFSVTDNGIGIPKDNQAKIFQRFYRGSNSSKLDPGGGSGLGLYIAKGVVEQAGGKIWFDTEENKGTTFTATFPIAK